MRAIVVNTQGFKTVVELAEPIFESVMSTIGGYFEIVRPSIQLKEGLVLVVDEEGHLKQKRLNRFGTRFYPHSLGIVGTLLVMREGMTPEGQDFIDLTDEDIIDIIAL